MLFLCVQATTSVHPYLCQTFQVSKQIHFTGIDGGVKWVYLHSFLRSSDFPLNRNICVCPGHETFSGRCFHSWEYKDADAYRGKRVVVVGIGNSGGDIAVELSRSAKKVKHKNRKPSLLPERQSWN